MRLGLISISIFLSVLGSAQNQTPESGTGSPLNALGFGRLNSDVNVSTASMGSSSIALGLVDVVNLKNPATYNLLGKTSFDVGLQNELLSLEEPNSSGNSSSAYFKNALLGLPIANSKFGLAFGLVPFSSHNYNFSEEVSSGIGSIENRYEGTGGVNELVLGASYRVLRDTINYFSVGVNASYYFGSINAESRVVGANEFNTIDLRNANNYFIQGFGFNYGLFYGRKLNKKLTLNAGASLQQYTAFKTDYTNLSETFKTENVSGIPTETVRDTINYENFTYNSELKPKVTLGLSALIDEQHYLSIEYISQNWKGVNETRMNGEFDAFQKFAFGYQSIAGPNAGKFFEDWRLRLGFNYSNNYVSPDISNKITEYGISQAGACIQDEFIAIWK